jgi:hypothetical protein
MRIAIDIIMIATLASSKLKNWSIFPTGVELFSSASTTKPIDARIPISRIANVSRIEIET